MEVLQKTPSVMGIELTEEQRTKPKEALRKWFVDKDIFPENVRLSGVCTDCNHSSAHAMDSVHAVDKRGEPIRVMGKYDMAMAAIKCDFCQKLVFVTSVGYFPILLDGTMSISERRVSGEPRSARRHVERSKTISALRRSKEDNFPQKKLPKKQVEIFSKN